ncbi:MAG: hypothetical protein EZS28_014844 [Streblomastix strix]|uniref:Protein kinase domain-containing protein n=1 Tax=Streblomastix strix TaxID=222440 RepID=A0A5J4W5C0_9EUKA|nr:MAG: hypothetical protein EZS28_014844 [Streblomastix strix]
MDVYNPVLDCEFALKIIQKDKFDLIEMDASFELRGKPNQFLNEYYGIIDESPFLFVAMQFANMKTLSVISKYPRIHLPSYTFRALMKQTLEGIRVFHEENFIHGDIKCDNILLHSPLGSGRVYIKISDFGFAKKIDQKNEQQYAAGTRPYMSPELFQKPVIVTQKVDIYAIGITFYHLITHKYPVNERNFKDQGKKLAKLKSIDRPSEIKNDILWDLLSKMLEFDPNKRITASEALQHPYFTSPEAKADISLKQKELAYLTICAQQNGQLWIQENDMNSSFIIDEQEIQKFLIEDNIQIKLKQQQQNEQDDKLAKEIQLLKEKKKEKQRKFNEQEDYLPNKYDSQGDNFIEVENDIEMNEDDQLEIALKLS